MQLHRPIYLAVIAAGLLHIPIALAATTAPATTRPAVPPTPSPAAIPPAPVDPTAIERPEFRTKPKPLIKSITSITAMMVQMGKDGEALGVTSDIIATVPAESRNGTKSGIGFVRNDGDPTMRTALDEAVRAITLRYPLWEPGHIDISFGEKFVPHGGPSAGTAFGVLMLSTLEGFDIDPKCAVTGDITVDWKVRKVGGVTAKVHGATLDKCLFAAIPEGNETAFADMAVLYGNAALWNIQVFTIATLQDAVALARKDRDPKLAEAIKLFAALQPQLTTAEKPTLDNPETKKTLNHILELAPNHISAKHLLDLAEGRAPKTLSANATLYQVTIILHPYRALVDSNQNIDRKTLPIATTVASRKRMATLRPIANKEIAPLLTDVTAYIESMEAFASSSNKSTAETLKNRATALDARFAAMSSDKELLGRLMREGY